MAVIGAALDASRLVVTTFAIDVPSVDLAVDRVSDRVSLIPLTLMLVGALLLAGATVIIASAVPQWMWPKWLRRRHAEASPPALPARPLATQRRVVTGRPAALPPIGVSATRQLPALRHGRRPTHVDALRAEALVDHYLEHDPVNLAQVLSSWIATDDRKQYRRDAR